jgi:hypothetical protein
VLTHGLRRLPGVGELSQVFELTRSGRLVSLAGLALLFLDRRSMVFASLVAAVVAAFLLTSVAGVDRSTAVKMGLTLVHGALLLAAGITLLRDA